ncbi:metallo-beta-lactamase family protein [Oceanicola granulosus HTCC2516]|uniref:Metallo-beta-lactamase family protein n=1 Tax=Oceanicola granulosus (strain ATCC BAA-861 / DSM 15982 / KCTC 12143 / HTCC2516) TaxID=314256 RepID=Q2CCE8_OCEGH|nr:MBL fold metallo-hydrolase [Oceanicola granulosus]EAR50370.1 metallo-beta-lactamase family protein [Oceanicola granulosus HTCC2516]
MSRETTRIVTPWPEPPEDGTAREVAEGVLWVRLALPMALDHVNAYALDDGDGWTLLDPGLHDARTVGHWEALLAGPLAGRPVWRVVVTHHHPDHIGMAGWFQRRGAELWTTRTAYVTARMLVLDEQESWPDETVAHYRGAGMDAAVLAERLAQRPFNFADSVAPLRLGYRRLVEGERVRLGGRDWDVRMGDGHAPEHATFWSRDDDLVLGGDQLLGSITPNIGVYPTEPLADPLAEWIAACRRLAPHARADQLVLPGHRLPFRGLPDRLAQFEAHHERALARLHAHLAEPRTAAECFPPLFRRRIGAGEYGLALGEALAHCHRLWYAGRATRERRGDAWVFAAR